MGANWKQVPAALTNRKQENVDQIQANNVIKRSGVLVKRNKYINNFCLKQGHLKKFKTLLLPLFRPRSTNACQQNFNSSRDPVPF